MTSTLVQSLALMPSHYVVNVVIPGESHENFSDGLLHLLTVQKREVGSYVTLDRPADAIKQKLVSAGMDGDRVSFIHATKDKNSAHRRIKSPKHLKDLKAQVEELCKEGLSEFVILDAVHHLEGHNKQANIAKFLHYFVHELKRHDIKGYVLASEATDADLLSITGHFCDKVVHIKNRN